MDTKKLIKQYLTEETSKCKIDIKKLTRFATGIELVCFGEYGNTYYHPTENAIFICLGDSNPFDEDALKQFVFESAKKFEYQKDITIEIENESQPNQGEGWMKFQKDKFISW